jgi:hypothetical protein
MISIKKNSFCFLALILFSCKSDSLSPDAYQNWVKEHYDLLNTSQQNENIITSLTYLPINWLAINEVGVKYPKKILAAKNEYEGLEYFRLRISATSGQGDLLQLNAASTDDYYQRVEYFSFGMQDDLRLIMGSDTLPCSLFHYERNYGAAPYLDFMLGFAIKEISHLDYTLLYYDRVYAKSLIQMTIPISNINSIPTLNL